MPGRRVGGQRDALIVGGHAHVAEPAGRARPGQRAPSARRSRPAGSRSMPWSVAEQHAPRRAGRQREGDPRGGRRGHLQPADPAVGRGVDQLVLASRRGFPPLLADRQATISSLAFTAPSSAPAGWPSGLGWPDGARGDQRAHPLPRRAAVDRPGVQRPVRREQVAAAAGEHQRGGLAGGAVGQPGGRGAHRRPAAARGGSGVQREAGALAGERGPPPVHDAHSANTRLPTVSRSVTRSPWVSTGAQVLPPVWVTHSSGPNAHPSFRLRNLIWLTPVAPSGAPVSGAGTPAQVLPGVVGARHRGAVRGGAVARACWPGRSPSRCRGRRR